jgi:2-methylcitrate dehydratase
MSFQRDLAWQHLDLVYQSSISRQLARYAIGMKFELLPQEVVHGAKRCLLDALGCAIGAYDAPGRPMLEGMIRELGGTAEASLFGSGSRTTALNASLFNSFLVRFLDYNDMGGGGHNSDGVSSLLAVAEREKATGRDLLVSIVISYELGERISASATLPKREKRSLSSDSRGGMNMPPALGRLMRMDEEQIAHAIGLCASHSNPLIISDAHTEEVFMSRNIRFGWVAYDAVLSCLMAKKGITGPLRVVEGEGGFGETAFQGHIDYERLIDFSGWRILKVRHKSMCANTTTQGHIMATLAIVKENDLKPEDIEAVHIRTGFGDARHTASILSKKYPRNAETAGHSAFYANAIAIKDRCVGPDCLKPENFTDPVVLDLIEKITVEVDSNLPEFGSQGISEITTKDGRRFKKHVEVPHGIGADPLSDKELDEKFAQMASKYYKPAKVQELSEVIWNIDKCENVDKLVHLMAFASK